MKYKKKAVKKGRKPKSCPLHHASRKTKKKKCDKNNYAFCHLCDYKPYKFKQNFMKWQEKKKEEQEYYEDGGEQWLI